jgi:hypothetical protein
MKIKDEWNVIVTSRFVYSSHSKLCTETFTGFNKEELANAALEKILLISRKIYDRCEGVVIKIKDAS